MALSRVAPEPPSPGPTETALADAPPPSHARLSAALRRACARTLDAELVRAVLEGDRSAAPTIVKRYRPLLRRYLGAALFGDDIEDLVQEVFARCFEHLARLRDPGALRSFLIGITLRLVGTERRRRRVRRCETLTVTGELPEASAVEDDVETRHAARRTREILDQLRPETCLLLELRFVQEKKLREVAASVGVSVATAKRQLARSSARFRAMAERQEAVVDWVRDRR